MAIFGLVPGEAAPVFGGALLLGVLHGAEPGHGWPIAAAYAFERQRPWAHGLAASVLLGLGHLVSSLAVVGAFFLAKSALALERLNEPLLVLGHPIGGPVGVVAGALLIGLGLREYRRGAEDHHPHATDTDGNPGHDHDSDHRGWLGRIRAGLPFGGRPHSHHSETEALDRTGLAGIVWTAFVLGFVHEEEFEIIGLCLGSTFCLELMVVYALAVLVTLVGVTMLLITGYRRYEARVERYATHFPTVSAVVLIAIGLGFVLGLI